MPDLSETESLHDACLAGLSQWIDDSLTERSPEGIVLHRTMKVAEEAGEVIAAVIGWTGANPRKGQTHDRDDVIAELLDVAVTALGAVEHLTGNQGKSREMLDRKILTVADRAGVLR